MKYLAFFGLLAVGLLIGYLVGVRQVDSPFDEVTDTTELNNESEEDTPRNKPKEKPVENEIEIEDSLQYSIEGDSLGDWDEELDTLSERILPRDTTADEELNIKRYRMITSRRVPIVYLEEAAEKDSVIKDLLGIKENRPTDMIIQFWESPLCYSGYKLSRNTLVLYGLSDQFKYTVYFKGNNYYLATKELFYVLKETSDFLSFKSADRNAILND